MSKFLFIDTETTGTEFDKHGIWQIAGCIYIDNEVKETFKFECAPLNTDQYDETAVKMSGKTIEQMKALQNPAICYRNFISLLSKYVDKFDKTDKFFFVGYNAQFDMQMLRSWFKKFGDVYFGSWFWFPALDVMALAAWNNTLDRKEMPDFKLGTLAQKYNITLQEGESLHQADADIRLTFELAKKLTDKILT
jgi:DNA polymerase-3 subunit epsilon